MENKFRIYFKKEKRFIYVTLKEICDDVGRDDNCNDDVMLFSILIEDGVVPDNYTGLKDKNKKEIYEGDIIDHRWVGNNSELIYVEWNECRSGFKLLMSAALNSEIIGNKYENPELLEKL